jgi:DNA helicase HerA-like ATPase
MMNLNDTDVADHTKYRLVGDSVLSYRFAVPFDENLFVGDILKIADREKGSTFFAKVTDLSHASNFDDPRWDTRPHTDRFYGLGEDVFLLVEAIPLGYVDARGTFRKPRTIPTKFSRVERPVAEDFLFLRQVMGDLEVGVMRTGQGVLSGVRVALHSRVMPQHMGVFATTGMGKSNFMKVFCASAMRAREFGLVLVDPHGEYVAGGSADAGRESRGLVHCPFASEGLSVFTIRDETYRKKYSLSSLWLEYDDFRAEDMLLLFEHSSAQREVIEMLDDVAGSVLVEFFQRTEFDEARHWVETCGNPALAHRLGNFAPTTLSVIKRHLQILTKANPFLRARGSSLPEMEKALTANRVVLIDLPGMGERSELFILSVITRRVLESRKKEATGWGTSAEGGRGQILVTIEEAQRVLGEAGSGTRVFRECAMEGRKFGVGLCVVTQQPRNIDPRVLAQLNTYVVMGLSDRSDRAIVAGHAKQDLSPMDTEIQTLDQGDAIISTLGIPFPVSTRIHLYEDYVRGIERKPSKPAGADLPTRF